MSIDFFRYNAIFYTKLHPKQNSSDTSSEGLPLKMNEVLVMNDRVVGRK